LHRVHPAGKRLTVQLNSSARST